MFGCSPDSEFIAALARCGRTFVPCAAEAVDDKVDLSQAVVEVL
jgi:hypothetical protein